MNITLRRFLESSDDAERERLLEELILEEAIPPVRRMVSYRLRYCLGGSGSALLHPDAEDLCHDIIARLVRHLEILRARRDPTGIRDFGQYAARVAVNACNDYLRQRYPARARLKDKLRDLLERHSDFALWRSETTLDEFWCGFTAWRQVRPSTSNADRVRRSLEGNEGFGDSGVTATELRQRPLSGIVAELLSQAGGPLEFEALLGAVAEVLEIKGESLLVFDDEQMASKTRDSREVVECESRIEKRELLSRVWQMVRQLPAGQRAVFFFGFRDESGDDLLSLLLDTDLATPVEIAAQVDLSLEGLMSVWREMPLDNAAIAAFLGTSRQQVNKLRFRAYRRLREQLLETGTRK